MSNIPHLDDFCIWNIVRFVPLDDMAPLARVSRAWRGAVIDNAMDDWPAGPLIAQGNIMRLLIRAHEARGVPYVSIEEIGRAAAAGHRHTVRLAMNLGVAHLEAVAVGALLGGHPDLALEALGRFPRAECGCFTSARGTAAIAHHTYPRDGALRPVADWLDSIACDRTRTAIESAHTLRRGAVSMTWSNWYFGKTASRVRKGYAEYLGPLVHDISHIWYESGPDQLATYFDSSPQFADYFSRDAPYILAAIECMCDPDLCVFASAWFAGIPREPDELARVLRECGEKYYEFPPWAIMRTFRPSEIARESNLRSFLWSLSPDTYGLEDMAFFLGPELTADVIAACEHPIRARVLNSNGLDFHGGHGAH